MTFRGAILARAAAAALAAVAVLGCEGGDDGALTVVISTPEVTLSGASRATLVVDYSGAGARIVSEDGTPACAFVLPGVDGEFADDRQGTLTIRASGPRALRGPADIAACRMLPSDPEETAEDLHGKLVVRLAGAEDAAGKAIDVATAKAGRGSSAPTQKEIDAAQAAAVQAAASIAPPPQPASGGAVDPSVQAGSTGRPGAARPAGASGSAGATAAGAAPPGGSSSADRASAPQNPAAGRPASPASVPRTAVPAAPQPVEDPGQAPAPVDRDRNYDDSPSEDESAPAYDLTIGVRSGGRFGALQLEINHLGGSGGFIGRGDQVDCVSMVEAIAAANYVGERTAKIGLISLAGINTPANVVRCGFRTREPLSPNSFNVVVVDAADTESQPLEPQPTVAVTGVMRR